MQSGVSFGLSAHRAGVSLVRSRICCRLGSSSLGFTGFGSGLGVSGVSTGGVGNLGCTGQLGASTTTSGVVGGEGRRRTGVGGDGEGGVAGRGGGGAGALGKESRAGGGGRLNGTSSSSSHSLKLLSSSSLSKLCNKTSLKKAPMCNAGRQIIPPLPFGKFPKKITVTAIFHALFPLTCKAGFFLLFTSVKKLWAFLSSSSATSLPRS